MPRRYGALCIALLCCLGGAAGCAIAPEAPVGRAPAPPPAPAALVPIRDLLAEALTTTAALPKPAPADRNHEWLSIAIAKAQARIGDVPDALQTLQRIPNPHSRASALTDLLRILVRHGDLAVARQIPPQFGSQLYPTLRAIAVVLTERGRVAEAMALPALQFAEGRPYTRQSVVRTLARLGHVEQARALIDPQFPGHERVVLLLGIAEGLIDRLPGRGEAA